MIAAATSWVVAHRRVVIAVLLLLAAAAAAGMPRLESDFTVDELFADAGDQRRIAGEFRQTYGNTDNTLVILIESERELSAAHLDYISMLSQAAGELDGVSHVTSISTVPILDVEGGLVSSADAGKLIAAAAASPILRGRLISPTTRDALIVLQLEAELSTFDDLAGAVERVEALIADAARPERVSVSLGGLPFIRVAVVRAMNRDQVRLLPIGFAICLLILFVSFRWLPALFLPLVVVGIAALVVVGSMAWIGVSINVVNNLVPLLIVIIGVSDSIHLISRHLEEHASTSEHADSGERSRVAARRSTERVAVACLLTSLTTAIGFASLCTSRIAILRGFGLLAAVGVLVAFLVTVTFLPAVLSGVSVGHTRTRALMGRLSLGRLARALFARRVAIVLLFVVLGGAALWICRGLTVDEGVRRQFTRSSSIGQTMTVLEEEFNGLRPLELSLTSSLEGRFVEPEVAVALDRLTSWARAQRITLSSISIATFLREVRLAGSRGALGRDQPLSSTDDTNAYAAVLGSLKPYINADRSKTRISIGLADVGSAAILEFAEKLRQRAEAELGAWDDIEIAITGEGYSSSLGLESLIHDLARSLAVAIFGIFVVLVVAFRSVRLGLIGLPPSALPIAFGLAYMTARGIPLGTATVIVFSVALGLAVDGTIHVITRFREEVAINGDGEGALVSAIDSSGRAVIATCLTLIAGFGILGLSSFVPVRYFGELIAVCIVGTVLCQLLLLPPLLALFGKSS